MPPTDLAPPIAVVDLHLDSSRPVSGLRLAEHYRLARLVVRIDGHAIGSMDLPLTAGICAADTIRHALLQRFEDRIVSRWWSSARVPPDEPADARALAWPSLSVVVSTRNRTDDLAECLVSLAAVDYPGLDVIVVDNAPADDRSQLLVASHPGARYVREDRPGLSRARRAGVAASTSEIVAFVDDDVRVDAGWARALGRLFRDHAEVMAILGLVAPLELETGAQVQFEAYGGFGRGFVRRWLRRAPGTSAAPALANTGTFGTGANMAFRRRIFEQVGSFDVALGAGTRTDGGEDLDMIFRVLSAGHTVVYEPDALVWHRHRRDAASLHGQIASWGRGMLAYLTRTWLANPGERRGITRLAAGLLGAYYPRRIVQALVGGPVDVWLTVAEFTGALSAPWRYRQARRLAADDPAAAPLPANPEPARTTCPELLVTVDQPIPAYLAVPHGAGEVDLIATSGGRRIGTCRVVAASAALAREPVIDALAARLDARLLDPSGEIHRRLRSWLVPA